MQKIIKYLTHQPTKTYKNGGAHYRVDSCICNPVISYDFPAGTIVSQHGAILIPNNDHYMIMPADAHKMLINVANIYQRNSILDQDTVLYNETLDPSTAIDADFWHIRPSLDLLKQSIGSSNDAYADEIAHSVAVFKLMKPMSIQLNTPHWGITFAIEIMKRLKINFAISSACNVFVIKNLGTKYLPAGKNVYTIVGPHVETVLQTVFTSETILADGFIKIEDGVFIHSANGQCVITQFIPFLKYKISQLMTTPPADCLLILLTSKKVSISDSLIVEWIRKGLVVRVGDSVKVDINWRDTISATNACIDNY
jgi:hypothetical protein